MANKLETAFREAEVRGVVSAAISSAVAGLEAGLRDHGWLRWAANEKGQSQSKAATGARQGSKVCRQNREVCRCVRAIYRAAASLIRHA